MLENWPLAKSQKDAIPIEFALAPANSGIWSTADEPQFDARDLGFGKGSNGVMTAHRFRVSAGVDTTNAPRRLSDRAFTFAIVLVGEAKLELDGKTHDLSVLDAFYLPKGTSYRLLPSSDFEAVFIRAGKNQAAKVASAGSRPVVYKEALEAYTVAAGPRDFFTYRNLDIAKITDGRMHIHVIRAAKQREGGTGWHTHSMSQWFMVLRGTGAISVVGGGNVYLHAGDAMTIGKRIVHNQTAYSEDYIEIEVCIPADYDTVPDNAPTESLSKIGWPT